MEPRDYDIKGRAIAHYFFDELEKIGKSGHQARLAAQEAARRAQELGQELGAFRFVPGTASYRKWSKARARAGRKARKADVKQLGEQSKAMKTRKGGKVRPGDVEKLRTLREQGAPPTRLHALGRSIRHALHLEKAPPPRPSPSPWQNPAVRRGLAMTALPVAGAGTLYAGQQYVKQQQGGYGGY
jgi:hypothetical protein